MHVHAASVFDSLVSSIKLLLVCLKGILYLQQKIIEAWNLKNL